VHISELAAHHVENPREIVSQGDIVNVKIIEMDADRRRLSLSLKRVEGEPPRPRPEGAPPLRLSEEVFSEARTAMAEPEGEADVVEPEAVVEELDVEAPVEEPVEEPQAAAEPEPEASSEPEAEPDGDAGSGDTPS
jgi:small subunit ribosomal protein S1